MANLVVFGNYISADSPVHAMDPRAKLTAVAAFIVIVFCAGNYPALAVCAAFTFAFYALSYIPPIQAFKSIAPLLFIVIITALLNLFFVQGGTLYADWGIVRISQLGVHNAVFLGIRLTLFLMGTSLLTLTTTTLDITDAFEAVLDPLRRVGFPAHEFAMIMGIALRFLPQFVGESRTIRNAQLSAARRFINPFRGGMQSLTSLMVPLFTSAFRHAETLSAGMDARCYHGGTGRTQLHPLRFGRVDAVAAIVIAAMLVGVIAATILFG